MTRYVKVHVTWELKAPPFWKPDQSILVETLVIVLVPCELTLVSLWTSYIVPCALILSACLN
jgi:hypothetical protein